MKGVQFVIDDSGKKKTALIDLEEWGALGEDFYDTWGSESNPSLPKRGIPPFCKACLPAGRGGKEGFNLWVHIIMD